MISVISRLPAGRAESRPGMRLSPGNGRCSWTASELIMCVRIKNALFVDQKQCVLAVTPSLMSSHEPTSQASSSRGCAGSCRAGSDSACWGIPLDSRTVASTQLPSSRTSTAEKRLLDGAASVNAIRDTPSTTATSSRRERIEATSMSIVAPASCSKRAANTSRTASRPAVVSPESMSTFSPVMLQWAARAAGSWRLKACR